MEALGTALLTDEIPAPRAVTTIVPRIQIAEALRVSSPELFLDLEQGDDRSTVGIRWTHDELEQLLDRAGGDDILFTFDRDQLQLAFDDVEAHGLRERALVFTVAVAGALGSSAAIANAAPVIERGSGGAASVATVQALASASAGGITSNVRTPGLQIGDEAATATAPAVKVSGSAASDSGFLGVDSRDVTNALVAGGVLLAIAGAGFAGARHTRPPRPA